jgi:glycosyltransferase involved in cell wall biosynthesis
VNPPPPPSVTLIALLLGDRAALRAPAHKLLAELRYYAERDSFRVDVVIAIDGADWRTEFEDAELGFANARTLVSSNTTNHPGALANQAAQTITSDFVALIGVGSEVSTWYANLPAWGTFMQESPAQMIAGYRSPTDSRLDPAESHLVHQDDPFSSEYPHAWLQMLDLVPMSNTLIPTSQLCQFGGFTEAATMQRLWWWEYCLRISKTEAIRSVALQPVPGPNWHRYAFANTNTNGNGIGVNTDAAVCELLQADSQPRRVTPVRHDELARAPELSNASLAAISPAWRALPRAVREAWQSLVTTKGRPLKVVVIGGVNEPAHNQLCFFNYFALMRQWGQLNWRTLLDERAMPADLEACDLVIFSRVRNDHGVALMRHCHTKGIRTLYMLDDNWFWLGREWDEYAELFTPGAPPYENFLSCVAMADTTLTYSTPLAEDLTAHAKRVVMLPTNVDLRTFRADPPPARPRRLCVGYVGSLRKNMLAFDAIVAVAKQRSDIDVFVMSNALPDELKVLPSGRVRFEPYQFNYAAYAATVMRVRPDVLVAPVGHTRFEASKCPNKFLEISAAGAAGVYSRAEPYLSHVTDGETGLFADDTLASWCDAIQRLLDEPGLREGVAQTAYSHVAKTYDTEAVLPQFLAMLTEAITVTRR